MESAYEKIHYTNNGIRLNHTYGNCAAKSTMSYLHHTADFILYYFIRGTGNIKIEGKQYQISDGDIFLIHSSELFHCSIDDNRYHERMVLHIDPRIVQQFPFNCQELLAAFEQRPKGIANHIPSHLVRSSGLDKLISSIYENIQSTDSVSSVLTLCKTLELLAQLKQVLASSAVLLQPPDKENMLIGQVLTYLNKHFTEEISLSEIAREFNVSDSYLSHLFKSCVGSSLWDYVIFLRIHFVNRHISENISLEELSQNAGFQNYSNFYRIYKKRTGMTPLQFRQKQKL